MKWILIAFVFALLLMKAVHPAHSQSLTSGTTNQIDITKDNIGTVSCPAERPIVREVMDYTKPVSCFANAIFALRCPEGDGPCERYLENNCTPPVRYAMCLSQEELERAHQR